MNLKRTIAGLLTAVLLLPAGAFAAGESVSRAISTQENNCTIDAPTSIENGGARTVTITAKEGYSLNGVEIEVGAFNATLTPAAPNATAGNDAFAAQWQTEPTAAVLTITADPDPAVVDDIKIRPLTTEAKYNIRVNGSNIQQDISPAASIDAGKTATVTIQPQSGYKLTNIIVTNGAGTPTTFTGNGTSGKLSVTFAGDKAEVKGPIYGDLSVLATTVRSVPTYRVRVDVGNGAEILSGDSSQYVDEGSDLYIRVRPKAGYVISDVVCRMGNSYGSASPEDSYLSVGSNKYQMSHTSDGTIRLTLTGITVETELTFNTGYNENEIPITIEDGSYVTIRSSAGDTVAKGEDAEFRIYTTSERYTLNKVTVQVGDSRNTVSASNGEIRVGGRTYEMKMNDYGEVTLYIDNIREAVTVSATATSGSSSSRPQLTINSSSNMNITKNVSNSWINSGDDVTFYFTPYSNYQIQEITVRVGDNSRTASADSSEIRVGSVSYSMRRDSNGMVTLYLTNIRSSVTVAGRAYYSQSTVQPSGKLQLDKSNRSAFMNGYTDGTFRPDQPMTRSEAVVMLYRLSNGSNYGGSYNSSFNDVPSGSWYSNEVGAFVSSGILDADAYFRPSANITRAELAEMLYRLSGSPSSPYEREFSDTRFHRSSTAIGYGASQGWIMGYPDGTFRPDTSIRRSEVAALTTRVLGRTYAAQGGITYRDVPSTHWAYTAISLASSAV